MRAGRCPAGGRAAAAAAAEEEEGAEATPIGERIRGQQVVGRRARASARTEQRDPGRTGEGPLRAAARGQRGAAGTRHRAGPAAATMIALFNKLLDWFKALFWKEEMELTLVGLQYSGKTTFVNVIAVRGRVARGPGAGRGSGLSPPALRAGKPGSPPGMAGHRRVSGGGGAGPGRLGPSTAGGGPEWHATRSPS